MAELSEGQRALQMVTGFDCAECYSTGTLLLEDKTFTLCDCTTTASRALLKDALAIPTKDRGEYFEREFNCARALFLATAHRPVRNATLGIFLRVNEREVKRLIEVLRNDWHLPIGSLREPPYGYFWIASTEDFLRWFNPMRSQALSELRTAYRLCKRHYPELAGQLTLPLDTDDLGA